MRKHLLAVFAAVLALALCACASNENAGEESASTAAESTEATEPNAVAAVDAIGGSGEALATSPMGMSLQDYAAEHGTILEEGEDAEVPADATLEAYVPETLDRAVIGADNRITVADTFAYPYSAIAMMKVHASCGCSWKGTGFMVTPSVLLTASHCLCCTQHHQSADDIQLYFGYQQNGDYAYSYTGPTKYWHGTDFPGGYTWENTNWDVGIVRLEQDVGNQTGYFGMRVKSDAEFDGALLCVAGYRDGLLKYDVDTTRVRNNQTIWCYADAVSGNSGGPIFDVDTASAIYIAEQNTNERNLGCRITDEVFNKVFNMQGTNPPTKKASSSTRTASSSTKTSRDALVVKPSDTGASGYILPKSEAHQYTRSELSGLTVWELYVARNEIAARHGYIFSESDLSSYFKSKSWYTPRYTSSEFRKIPDILNSTEEKNIQTILQLEKDMGSTLVPRG